MRARTQHEHRLKREKMGELCVLPIGGEHGFGIDSFLYGHPTASSYLSQEVINCYVSNLLPTGSLDSSDLPRATINYSIPALAVIIYINVLNSMSLKQRQRLKHPPNPSLESSYSDNIQSSYDSHPQPTTHQHPTPKKQKQPRACARVSRLRRVN